MIERHREGNRGENRGVQSSDRDEESITLIDYDPRYAEETVRMWRRSKEAAIGQAEGHSFEDHVHFLNDILPRDNKVYLAIDGENGRVAGMAAFNDREISQLYIDPDFQGKGIGDRFVSLAKAGSSGKLTLYTFEVNRRAQRFYEKHGFRVVSRGHDNEEGLPDIKYEWAADGAPRDEERAAHDG